MSVKAKPNNTTIALAVVLPVIIVIGVIIAVVFVTKANELKNAAADITPCTDSSTCVSPNICIQGYCLPPCNIPNGTDCSQAGLLCDQGSGICQATPAGYVGVSSAAGCNDPNAPPVNLNPSQDGPDRNFSVEKAAARCNSDPNCMGFTWQSQFNPGNMAYYNNSAKSYTTQPGSVFYTKMSSATPQQVPACPSS